MAKIIFITTDGETIETEANGGTLMELAKENDIAGIEGECGGVCSCATCHVHIAVDFFEKAGASGDIEREMLELEDEVTEYSRLGCQVEITEDLNGMQVHVANE